MNKPVSLYNSEKRELIGVFSELIYVAKYLDPLEPRLSYQRVYEALKKKGRIYKSYFEFPVALRFATNEQVELLTDQVVIIVNGYPVFEFNKAIGFHTSKEEFRMMAIENMKGNKNAKKWINTNKPKTTGNN